MTDLKMPHAEAELLLPWYANRTLDLRERDAVGDHLEQCQECQQALALLARVNAAVTESATVPLIPDPRPERLFEQLDQQSGGPGLTLFSRKWAIAAGIVLVVISSALVFSWRSPDPTQPAYRTATSPNPSDQVFYVVEVRFAESATVEEHQLVLNELGATMISSAESGVIKAVVPIRTTSMNAAEIWRSDLVARAEIADARIVAVQLPVLEDE